MTSNALQHHPESGPAAEALVLNCIDHRLIGTVTNYLHSRGLEGRYDQISIAGGAIGVMSAQTKSWSETFWQHLDLARKLHGIRKVIVIDHRDCGACKELVGKNCADNREREFGIHRKWMTALANKIRSFRPGLEVELILMDLDGSVEDIDRRA